MLLRNAKALLGDSVPNADGSRPPGPEMELRGQDDSDTIRGDLMPRSVLVGALEISCAHVYSTFVGLDHSS